ncbi:MAG TPA: hypothetical protein VGP41_02855 [Candidatus Lustribacter sp.]|nr:hypothetical protein [Candidatus Lustribacter sp.]
MKNITLGFALTAALIVAGCGGGGSAPAGPAGGNSSNSSNSSGSNASASESAVSTTNAVGAPMNSLSDYNNATSSLQSFVRGTESVSLGTCQTTSGGGSYEFFSPDKNGDTNSTEQQYFYDNACAQLARDVVRVFTSTGTTSETVNRTVKVYAQSNSTAIATRTDVDTIRNATFDQYGFAIPADGFARSEAGMLQYSGTNAIASDAELVMNPASGSTETFCGDSAGYNVNGIAALGETFGWQGGVLSAGTRTVNPDGSVTWTATHAGATSKGGIGSLGIAAGTQNTSCPIATPMFTLTGGTSLGTYNIPTVATYKSGLLVGLTITGATLSSGATLNVTTNLNVSPTNSAFITGTIANGGTSIATFTVDAFGDGTLTMSSGGSQYVITDWHVVK